MIEFLSTVGTATLGLLVLLAVAMPLLAGTAFFLCMVLGWLCNLPQRMRKPG